MDVTTIYMKQLRKTHRLLPRDEEQRLARLAQAGDREAKETLVASVLPLVVRIARFYENRGIDLMDLIQVGNLGALHAVDKFDPERGCRLTTYATPWIKQKLRNEIEFSGDLIRLPGYLFDKTNKAGLTPEEKTRLRDMQKNIVRLDSAHRSESNDQTSASLVCGHSQEVADELDRETRARQLRYRIGKLPERERLVIRRRMAGLTLSDVGREIGVTKERVRQIELDGMKKLARMYKVKLPAKRKSSKVGA